MRPLLPGILLLLLAAPCAAQITMDRVAIGSGGGTISNGSLRMDLTISQPVSGSAQSGARRGDLGFWWQVPNSLVAVDDNRSDPANFALPQNTPNPFQSSTAIHYAIPEGQHVPVFIGVFSLQGGLLRTLVNDPRDPGRYTVTWDGRSDEGVRLPAGLYFLKIQAGPFQSMRKTVLLK